MFLQCSVCEVRVSFLFFQFDVEKPAETEALMLMGSTNNFGVGARTQPIVDVAALSLTHDKEVSCFTSFCQWLHVNLVHVLAYASILGFKMLKVYFKGPKTSGFLFTSAGRCHPTVLPKLLTRAGQFITQ